MKRLTLLFSILLAILLVFSGTAGVEAAAPPEKVDVLIRFDRMPGKSEENMVRNLGGDIKFTYCIVPAIAASVPSTAIQGLLRNPRVTLVEPDVEIHLTEDTYPWGVIRVGTSAAHELDVTGQGVKIAILDTGIDYTHPELASVYTGGYDFVNGDTEPLDDNGHGTHVAGTIAAAMNDENIIGIAPGAEIYALKVLDQNGSGSFSSVIAALEWATGGSQLPGSTLVDITNNSYGSSKNPGTLVEMAFYLAYFSDGVLNVAAAGNTGNSPGAGDNVIYPAAYDSVVAVAATDYNNDRASFSSTGPAVELSAPGVNIYSTFLNEGYATGSGTSMASPHVAGVAALVMSSPELVPRDANGDLIYETNGDGNWTNDEVRTLLRATATDLGATGKDNLYGYGLVNAQEAIVFQAESNTPPVADAGGPYFGDEDAPVTFNASGYDADGDTLTYSWDFGDGYTGIGVSPTHVYTAGGTYTVTLVVFDGKVNSAPSATMATITEINDLPVANAGPDQSAIENQGVNFDGSESYDEEDETLMYSWDFGDGYTGIGVSPTHVYTAIGTYTVTLSVTDSGGLTASDTAVVTVTAVPQYVMHIDSIELTFKRAGINTAAIATITVVDATGKPVSGATVHGIWSGATQDTDYGTTDSFGQVAIQSDYVKKVKSGTTFTFTIEGVELNGWTYDVGANVETYDSITTT